MGNQTWIFILFAVLIVGLMIWQYYRNVQRRKELQAWAKAKGITFDRTRDGSLDGRYAQFGCLHKGSRRYGYNHLTGQWKDRSMHGFDYHYETHSTDSKGRRQTHHHHFSAVVLESEIPLQPLFIRPEGFFDRLTEIVGFDDIDFESAEFSKAFYVKAPDQRWAFDVIHQRAMEFLLASPRFSIEFDRHRVIAFRDSRFSTDDYEAAADVLSGLLDGLPDYVVSQQTKETS